MAISHPKSQMKFWHERLGHLNARDLVKMIGSETGKMDEITSCEICLKGKMTALPFTKRSEPCSEKLAIVHSDVVGPLRVESLNEAKFFVTFIDDSTSWCEIYLMKHKRGVLEAFKTYKSFVEKNTGKKIKVLQSDNGREFCNTEFDIFLRSEGIERRLTIAHTPQKNGIAERMNRTILEMARCMFLQSKLTPSFWGEAVTTACHVRNRCPTSCLGGCTPYEKWTGESPNLDHLRIFRAKVYVLNKIPGKDKFAPRSRKGTFVGYPRESKGYRIWIPAERKIVIARDIKFLEQTTNDRDANRNKKPEVEMNIRSEKPKEVLIETGISSSVDQSMQQPMVPSNQGRVLRSGRELLHPSTSGNRTVKRGPGQPRFLRTGTRERPRKQYKNVKRSG